MTADKVRGIEIVKEIPFPSDKLIDILSQIQLRNGCITWPMFRDRRQQVFRKEIRDTITHLIYRVIRSIENGQNFTRSIDLSRDGMFYITFGTELLKSLQHIVGCLKGGEQDDVLHLLYQELIPFCKTHTLRGMVSHEFRYIEENNKNGKFVIAPSA